MRSRMGQGRESTSLRTDLPFNPAAPRVAAIDVRAYANRYARERFVAFFPMHFLVGMNRVTRPRAVVTAEVPLEGSAAETVELTAAALHTGVARSGTFLIGRDPRSDIVLHERHVSRCHAAVRVTPDLIRLTDLGSTTGTFLNDRRLSGPSGEALLPGDRITLGVVSLRLLGPGEAWDYIRGA